MITMIQYMITNRDHFICYFLIHKKCSVIKSSFFLHQRKLLEKPKNTNYLQLICHQNSSLL